MPEVWTIKHQATEIGVEVTVHTKARDSYQVTKQRGDGHLQALLRGGGHLQCPVPPILPSRLLTHSELLLCNLSVNYVRGILFFNHDFCWVLGRSVLHPLPLVNSFITRLFLFDL